MDEIFEREIAIVLLELTKDGSTKQELINHHIAVPMQVLTKLLRRLQSDGMLYVHKGNVHATAIQRIKLATHALQTGGDFERVSTFLSWREFEDLTAWVLEQNGFDVKRNLRFRQGGRRWELDIVGFRQPLVLCGDCKHWSRSLCPSMLKKMIKQQARRTRAFIESIPSPSLRVDCGWWDRAKFVPVIFSLVPPCFRFYDGTPVVPILQLQDFLIRLSVQTDLVKHFSIKHPLVSIDS